MSTPEDKIPQEDPLERQERIRRIINETLASDDFVPGIAGVIPDDRGPGVFESVGRIASEVGSAIASGIDRFAGGGFSRDVKGAFRGDVRSQARLVSQEGLFLLEGINQGFVQPTANLIEFLAEIADVVGLDEIEADIRQQTDELRSTLGGLITQAEDIALRVGFDERTVAKIRVGGGLVGFLAPLSASLKVATGLTGLHTRLGSNITRDFVAGNVLGLFNTQGDLEERGKHAIVEGSLFGGFALLGAAFPWVAGFRSKRGLTRERFSPEKVAEANVEIAAGKAAIKDGQEAIVFDVMKDEEIIAQSVAAREILVKNADIDAVVAGLRDVASDRTGHVLIQRIGDQFAFKTRMAELFPGMGVDIVKGAEGFNAVISFGKRGLNNPQRAMLKKTGMFEGMRVSHGGVEREVAGLSTRPGFIKVRPLDGGKPRDVMIENLSIHGSGRSLEIVPGNDGLYKEFSEWFNSRLDNVARNAAHGVSKDQLIDDVLKGKFTLDEVRLRETVGDVIISPFEAGMDASQKIVFDVGKQPGVRLNVKPVSPAELQLSPQQAEGKAFLQILRGDQPVNAMLEIRQTERGLLVTGLDGASLEGVPRRTAKVLAERIAEIIPDVQHIEMLGIRNPVFETIQSNVARGANDFFVVPPQTLGGFDEMVAVWMREQGIAGADAQIFKEFAAQRMRRELFESLPETEKTLITNLRKQYADILNQGRTDLEFMATSQGFKFQRGVGGTATLTDATTGAEFFFTNEKGVRNALRVARTRRDLVESTMLPADFAVIAPPHSPNLMPTGEVPSTVAISNESVAQAQLAELGDAKLTNNLADLAKKFERDSGFPLFTGYVDDVLKGTREMRNSTSLDFPNIEKNLMQLGRGKTGQMRRLKVAMFWRSIEGKDITRKTLNIRASRAGLDAKEIAVMNRAMDIFNVGGIRAGIPPDQFVLQYFGRIQPKVQAGSDATRVALYGNEPVPPAAEAFFRHIRRGNMDPIEMDPLLVQLSWFRSEAQEKFVSKAFDKMATLTGFGRTRITPMKMGDLPQGQQAGLKKLFEETGIPFDINGPVLPQQITDVYNTMLMNLQGGQARQASALTKIFMGMYRMMGVDVTEPALKQMFNDMLSSSFGALVGSGKAVARNATTQINFMTYVRYGGKHLGEAIRIAGTRAGYDKTFADGVLGLREGGVAGGDVLFKRYFTPGEQAVEATNAFGRLIAPMVRLQMKGAHISAGFARKVLVPFSSTDDINRVRDYFNTRLNVADEIAAFKAGKITEQEFMDNAMIGFTPQLKEAFFKQFKVSEESALQFAGRMVTDENQFQYGLATQPLYLQTTAGKLAGMFSSWPLWAKEFYTFRFMNMTAAQKRVFIARTSITSAAIGITGSTLGYNLWSWVSPTAIINYSGGPPVDVAEGIRDIVDKPFNQKVGAVQRVAREIGRMAFPGQQAARDITRVLSDTSDPQDMVLGLLLGRQTDRGIEIDFSDLLDEEDKKAHFELSTGRAITNVPLDNIVGTPQTTLDPSIGERPLTSQP